MTILKFDDAVAEPRTIVATRELIASDADRDAAAIMLRRERDHVSRLPLNGAESLKLSREIRALALAPSLPDSTPRIRADRDAG